MRAGLPERFKSETTRRCSPPVLPWLEAQAIFVGAAEMVWEAGLLHRDALSSQSECWHRFKTAAASPVLTPFLILEERRFRRRHTPMQPQAEKSSTARHRIEIKKAGGQRNSNPPAPSCEQQQITEQSFMFGASGCGTNQRCDSHWWRQVRRIPQCHRNQDWNWCCPPASG